MAGTPNVRRTITALRDRFDLLYGVYNPRHIGSNPLRPWSQHAAAESAKGYFGNGIDIVHIDYGYSDDPRHQAELDKVYAYLDAHRDELGIRQILWRVRSHFNHIHVDFWPKMADEFWRRHPTKGGPVVVRYEDGTLGDTYGGLLPAPPPPPSNMDDMFCAFGDTDSENVRYWQRRMNRVGGGLTVDGGYGKKTQASVVALADGDGFQILSFEADAIEAVITERTSPEGPEGPVGPTGPQGFQGVKGDPGEGISTGDQLAVTVN